MQSGTDIHIALMIYGTLTALKNGMMRADSGTNRVLIPAMLEYYKESGISGALTDIIEEGLVLEDIAELFPQDAYQETIDALIARVEHVIEKLQSDADEKERTMKDRMRRTGISGGQTLGDGLRGRDAVRRRVRDAGTYGDGGTAGDS